MIKKVFCLTFLLLLGAGLMRPETAAAATARLSRVTLLHSSGRTWARLTLSRVTSVHYFTLDHPHRVVLDLDRTRFGQGDRLPQDWGGVRYVRVGRRPGGALRVVFVLASAATPSLTWRRGAAGTRWLLVELDGEAPGSRRSYGRRATGRAPAADSSAEESSEGGAAESSTAAGSDSFAPTPVAAAHAPRDTGRDIIIAVDPGHGGVDPGTIGRYGTQEKAVTLAIGRLLARRIDVQRGMRAVLTRDSDVFVPLRERMAIARQAHADLFVSIHCNAVSDRDIKGAQVYILSLHGASSEAARILAREENAADLKGGIPLQGESRTLASVLLNLSQSAAIAESMTAARDVVHSMSGSVPILSPKVQQAAFVVLKSPDIPSMLVETDYLSDPVEELRLRSPAYRRKIADAIFRGILTYFREHPPAGSLFAEQRLRTERLLARTAR